MRKRLTQSKLEKAVKAGRGKARRGAERRLRLGTFWSGAACIGVAWNGGAVLLSRNLANGDFTWKLLA